MKLDTAPKLILLALVSSIVFYFAAFHGMEYLETRHGPWKVTFTRNSAGDPELVVDEPKLNISGVKIVFPGAKAAFTNANLEFSQPQQVPFNAPFGECVFEDTMFLPGTIAFSNVFGHVVQLIPRVLTIDHHEYGWQSDSIIRITTLSPAPTNELPRLTPTK